MQSMVQVKKIIYASAFKGEPTSENFKVIEEELPELKDGEILIEAVFLSVDPYMRPIMDSYPEGTTMIGSQTAKIIESKNEKYPKGSFCFSHCGWRTRTVLKPKDDDREFYLLPDFGNLPLSLAVGACGMPGNSAYFGFLEICQPKKGETVVVSTAAGAIGSLVGQIAKIKGCRVIGITGSDEKCKWIVDELGFDKAINYKTADLKKELKEAAPKGIDCYFDNTGGKISETVIEHMNDFGRISCCGVITEYNGPRIQVLGPQCYFIFKQLKMEGFIVYRWVDRWMEGVNQMIQWIQEGKIKYKETVTEGFENMPQALIDLLRGKNFGKAIVKV